MKKRTISLGILCLICYLCLNPMSAVAHEEQETPVKVEKVTEKKEYNTKQGEKGLILSYAYPQITGPYVGIPIINENYKKQRDIWFEEQKELIELVQKEDIIQGIYGNEVVFQVTCNRYPLICILHQGYLYTGGAHGLPYRTSSIYNVDTGKEVTPMEYLKKDEKQLKEEVNKAFRKKFEQDPSMYWENANKIVEEIKLSDMGYYLTNEGMVFFLDPYIVAPFAGGFSEVILK